jgi:RND family efflux transporter MFP subunit
MKTIIIILITVGLAAAGWRYAGPATGSAAVGAVAAESALYTAKRGDMKIIVTENGYLKAKNNVEIKPKFRRSSTITWLIEEGSEVVEGDKLAEFEKTDVENEVDEENNDLAQYQIELEAAEAELEIQKRDATAQVETAEFALKMVNLKKQKYTEGEGPNELRKMKLAAEKAKSEFGRAEERFEQVPELAAQGFFTPLEVEVEKIELREAEITMENAANDLRIWTTYTNPMELEQLDVDMKNAERDLANAQEKADINIKENEARVQRIRGRVEETQAELKELAEELEHMTIHAPAPGIVHYGDPRNTWFRDQIKVGNSFHRGNTMFTLPDLSEMQVFVQVHEADIDLLHEDQEVVITVDAAKGQAFKGSVTQIAAVASSDWMDEANKTFRVEITMAPMEDVELRAGITAKAEVQIETIPDVIQVPIHAVVAEGGKEYCFIPDGAVFEKREVEIGKNNAHYVVITTGLEAGEQVLLYDPRETSVVESAAMESEDEESGLAPAMTSPGGAP